MKPIRIPNRKPKPTPTGKEVTEAAKVRQRKRRAAEGARALNFTIPIEVAAGILYLQQQWGFRTYKEAVEAAVRFTAIATKFGGLERLPQDVEALDLPDVSQ